MRILCDMDGVLADTHAKWLGILNAEFGETLAHEDILSWDLHEFCKVAQPKDVYGILNRPGFFRDLPPVEDAIEGFQTLLNDGHDLVIVTSCPRGNGEEDKRAWLETHLPTFDVRKNFISATRKELVRGDILIDDGIHNLTDWKLAYPDCLAICFAQPWNRKSRFSRVPGWATLVAGIKILQQRKIDLEAQGIKTTSVQDVQRRLRVVRPETAGGHGDAV